MSTKTVINIKADKDVKEQAQYIAERLGVPLSSIINSFLKQFIRTEEVTFSIASKMTPELEYILKEVEKDRKNNKNVSKLFTVEDAIKHLSSL
jgi:addiction module RelB/DinJ family antitoxin